MMWLEREHLFSVPLEIGKTTQAVLICAVMKANTVLLAFAVGLYLIAKGVNTLV
jgi:hypothetical protein